MNKISRTDARFNGSRLYFTGKPCPRGHIGMRYVSCGGCIACLNERKQLARQNGTYKENRTKADRYRKNPEPFRKQNSESYLRHRLRRIESVRLYRKNNPDKAKKFSHISKSRRRQREYDAKGHHSWDEIVSMCVAQHNQCFWCKADVSIDYHIDHIIPLSRGGTDYADNICISCAKCNLSRGKKLPDEWQAYKNVTPFFSK